MTLPDWVLNGTTYKDLGTVGDFSMMWNFNTREKARLTGGLFSKFLPSLLSWPFCRGAADERGLARLQLATLETRKGLEPKCVPSQPRPWDRYCGRVGELKWTLRSDNGDVHENVAEK